MRQSDPTGFPLDAGQHSARGNVLRAGPAREAMAVQFRRVLTGGTRWRPNRRMKIPADKAGIARRTEGGGGL